MKLVFSKSVVLGIGALAASTAFSYDIPALPEIPRDTDYITDTEYVILMSQEDIFNRREVFEEWQADYRGMVANSVYLADDANRMRRLGSAVVRYELDFAEWREARNALTSKMRQGHSEMLLQQEQMKILGMRAKLGERIPVSELSNVQLESRRIGIEVAKTRLERAELDSGFYERRYNEINHLMPGAVFSKDEVWEVLMKLNTAKQEVVGAQKSLELAELALELALRQVEKSKK